VRIGILGVFQLSMRPSITFIRGLLLLIVLGAAYVFWNNTGHSIDRAITQLHASALVLVVLAFAGLAIELPQLLKSDRRLAQRVLAATFGFFVIANSLRLLLRLVRGSLSEVVQWSGLSVSSLLSLHVLNIMIVPIVLCVALAWGIRLIGTDKRVPYVYWVALVCGVAGLAYISIWPTWTVM
jgi:cytochrome bd-type quinol oxidase subunit 2